MPRLPRILLVCWAINLIGGALAQDISPSGKPAPPTRLDWNSGQQSFAQQYLAVPPSEIPHGTRPQSGEPVERFADADPLDLPNRAAGVAEPQSDFQRTLGSTDLPGAEKEAAGAPERGAAGSFSDDVFAQPFPQVPVPSSGEEQPEPPQLLPPPPTPPKRAPVEPQLPKPEKSVRRGESGQILPAMHVSEDVSDLGGTEVAAEGEGTGDGSSEDVAPLLQPREAMPLKPPAAAGTEGRRSQVGGLPSMVTVAGGLAVVLGIFFAVAWGMRRAAPGALTTLPKQVVEVLGRVPLASRQQVHLLRVGNKLLLVSATAEGVETLTEISDPVEVDRLAGLCEQANPNSSSAAFRRVLQQFAHEGKETHAA